MDGGASTALNYQRRQGGLDISSLYDTSGYSPVTVAAGDLDSSGADALDFPVLAADMFTPDGRRPWLTPQFRFVPRRRRRALPRAADSRTAGSTCGRVRRPPGTPVADAHPRDSWAVADGVYLFLGAHRCGIPRRSSAGSAACWPRGRGPGARLLWIADPNLAVRDWNPVGISLIDVGPEGGTLATLTPFPFRNYGCLLDGGLPLRLDAGGCAVHGRRRVLREISD